MVFINTVFKFDIPKHAFAFLNALLLSLKLWTLHLQIEYSLLREVEAVTQNRMWQTLQVMATVHICLCRRWCNDRGIFFGCG